MKPAVQRVVDAFAAQGIIIVPREFAEQTHTAQEAANAVGTTVAQIVKSLIFLVDEHPALFLVSGANQLDVALVEGALGQTIRRASAEQVRLATGFAIGGVPPFGHSTAMPIYFDRDLLTCDTIWAAAGTPNAVFPIASQVLKEATGAQVIQVAAISA